MPIVQTAAALHKLVSGVCAIVPDPVLQPVAGKMLLQAHAHLIAGQGCCIWLRCRSHLDKAMRLAGSTPVRQIVCIETYALLTRCLLVLCAYAAMDAAVLIGRVVTWRVSCKGALPSFGWHRIDGKLLALLITVQSTSRSVGEGSAQCANVVHCAPASTRLPRACDNQV
jgi:hypothetical protein